jgi:hypothetical protein
MVILGGKPKTSYPAILPLQRLPTRHASATLFTSKVLIGKLRGHRCHRWRRRRDCGHIEDLRSSPVMSVLLVYPNEQPTRRKETQGRTHGTLIRFPLEHPEERDEDDEDPDHG